MALIKLKYLFKMAIISVLIGFSSTAHAEYYIRYFPPGPLFEIVSCSPYAVPEYTSSCSSCNSSYSYRRRAYREYSSCNHHYHHVVRHHHYRRSPCHLCDCQSADYYMQPSFYYFEDEDDFDFDRRTADDVGYDMDIDY